MFENRKWKKLKEAVRQNDAAKVREVAKSLNGLSRKEGYFEACALAVECKANDALKALLEKGKNFDFDAKDYDADKACAHKLVDAALASPEPIPLLSTLFRANRNSDSRSRLENSAFLATAPIDFVQQCLEEDVYLFMSCVSNAASYPADRLKFILTFEAKCPEPQASLDKGLVQVAAGGEKEKAEMLVARKANANYDSARALSRAAEGGHGEMVNYLLPMVDLARYGEDIVTRLEQKNGIPSIIAAIAAATRDAVARASASAPEPTPEAANSNETSSEPVYTRRDSETLAKMQTLPDGATLMTLFNFVAEQQQTVVIPLEKDRPPGVSTPVSFRQLDEAVVTAMREKFDALGEKEKIPAQRTDAGQKLRLGA